MLSARRVVIAWLLLLGAFAPATAQPLRIVVEAAYAPHHVPLLTAVVRGHFKREGIDVVVEPGLGANMVAVLVGQRAFDIGHVTAPAAAAAIARGAPIRMAAVYQPRSALAFVGIKDRVRLSAPKAIEGLRVGVSPGTIDTVALSLFRRAHGIGISAVTIVPTDRTAKLTELIADRLDIVVGDGAMMRHALAEQDLEPEVMELADHGVPLMGFGFVASQASLAADPGLMKRAMAVIRSGFLDAAADPVAACAEVRARYSLAGTNESCPAALRAFLVHATPASEPDWGKQTAAAWQAMIEALRVAGEVQGTRPTSFYFTNSALP